MHGMKKRILVPTLIFILLVVLGTLGLSLRPIFSEDTMTDISEQKHWVLPLRDEQEQNGLLRVDYTWDLTNSPNDTLLLGNDAAEVFSLIHPAEWRVSCHIENGQCILRSNPPLLRAKEKTHQVRASYLAEYGDPFKQRYPDGSVRTIRTINLVCEVWVYRSFFQKPLHAFAVQEIKLELIGGSADLIRPYTALHTARNTPHVFVENAATAQLPSLFCGSACEQELMRMLYTMAAIDSTQLARIHTPKLVEIADKLQALQTDSQATWPDNWGEAAPTACKIARRIVPTLMRLQENDGFRHQELIDFINSEKFSRIFGEEFNSTPAPLSDMPPIRFEKVDDEKN